jgi:fructose-specific phosphotransferase system IIA component
MAEQLSEILDKRAVGLDLESKRKADVLQELVELAGEARELSNPEGIVERLAERERMSSTGIGNGIAIPHCMTDEVSATVLAIGRRKRGVKFDAADRRPVELFFLMLGPPGSDTEHLRLLSKLSRYLHDRGFHQALLKATSAEEVLQLFEAKEGG